MTAKRKLAAEPAPAPSGYDADLYAWCNEQAALLRERNFSALDIENIAEEIESLGRSEKRELENRLIILLLHLLKWQYQFGYQSRSWELSIKDQRQKLARHLQENPSLKSKLPEILAHAYDHAVNEAHRETSIAKYTFPRTCPYTYDQMTDDGFWPEPYR